MSALTDRLNSAGISAFGISAPVLSPEWTSSGATVQKEDTQLTLTATGTGHWLAPMNGIVQAVQSELPVTLIRADGHVVQGPGLLFAAFQQTHLRLARLYAQELEVASSSRPERDRGLPVRPVPRYFFYSGVLSNSDLTGMAKARDDLGRGGELAIFDADGLPIDPVAVAAALRVLLLKRTILDPTHGTNPLDNVAGAEFAGTAVVRLRLADSAGRAFDNSGSHLTGITAEADQAANGLFKLDAGNGGASGTIGLKAATGTSGDFPEEERRLIVFGAATNGRLSTSFTPPSAPSGVTLTRDFLSIRVERLKPHLLGARPSASQFSPMQFEKEPAIRIGEPLRLHSDGNDVLAAAAAALGGSPTEALCVAQEIDGGFDVPTTAGHTAHWPNFPQASGTPSTATLDIDLRDRVHDVASFIASGSGVDVALSLKALPAGAAFRVYPRRFVEDAREARGDGAGGIALANGTATVRLVDPLGLTRADGTVSTPANPTLRYDLIVVTRDDRSRVYGNIAAPIQAGASAPVLAGTNPFGSAARRGVCHAGVLGNGGSVGPLPNDLVQAALQLAHEGTPRDAPRFPTMARRETLVAGLGGGHWRSVIASGRLTSETHSADARRGSPGGRGGRETQVVGASTQNGRLAYDIARMAFRRTTNLATRIVDLADARWDEPTALTPPAAGTPGSENSGTLAGAVLQTIAPGCETPELVTLQSILDSIPANFDALVDWANQRLGGGSTLGSALNGLKGNAKGTRLYEELQREVVSAIHGRRDAQWALAGAISRARHFVYIESAGLARTAADGDADARAFDLFGRLAARMGDVPALRVMVCVPKFPDYGPGYEPFAAREAAERRSQIMSLPKTSNPDDTRVAAFHPIGFPGRSSRLETTVVVVDDVWAMVGSSTLRRRGLTFDGGSDLVFSDFDVIDGRSPAITDFRRRLIAERLGIKPTQAASLPDPRFVRLADGVEAFHVIRETIAAGGLGKFDLLWNGKTPGIDPIDPNSVPFELVNPEGRDFADPTKGLFVLALGLGALAGFQDRF